MIDPRRYEMAKHIPDLRIRNLRVIEFATGNETRGFHELMLSRAPIKVIEKNKYIVSDVHCSILNAKGIDYKIINKI